MGDFLKKALENGIYKPDGPHQQLSEIAQKYFGSPTEANIESVASFLALETPTLVSTKEYRATAYKQLIEIIVWTLRDIYDKPRSPEVKRLFSAFSGAIVDRNISLITLNYDLLIDQLLKDTGKWLPVSGYGVEFPLAGFLKNDPRLRDVFHPAFGRGLSESVLLKLHGSLNWGRRNVRYSDGSQPVELSHMENASRILPIQNMGVSRPGQPGTFRWDSFIVPPFVSKSSVSGTEPELENLWYHAWAALASADFIHFLGYSLPPSDFEMDILLREGFHSWLAEIKKKKVFVVDRDERVRERIATQLKGIEIDTSRSDIEAYLKELIDL